MNLLVILGYLGAGAAWTSALVIVAAFMGVGLNRIGVVLNVLLWPLSVLVTLAAILSARAGMAKRALWGVVAFLARGGL